MGQSMKIVSMEKMKQLQKKIVLCTVLMLLLAGCGQKTEITESIVDNSEGESVNETGTTDHTEGENQDSGSEVMAETDSEANMDSDSEAVGQVGEESVDSLSTGVSTEEGIDIDITEKMYVTWINEVYLNYENYLGQTVRIEGMYTSEYYDVTDQWYSYVYRTGPGCCGNDGAMCGFEFTYDGTLPEENDWIEVIGVLEEYEELGEQYLVIRATSVSVKSERGSEIVSQ